MDQLEKASVQLEETDEGKVARELARKQTKHHLSIVLLYTTHAMATIVQKIKVTALSITMVSL